MREKKTKTLKATLVKKLAKQHGIRPDVLKRLLVIDDRLDDLERNVFPLGK